MKNFILQKNKYKKNDKQPDYRLTANIGTKEEANWVECGSAWIRQNSKGDKFLSCVLSDAYVDHTKQIARKGFELVMEGQTEVAEKYEDSPQEELDSDAVGF